MLRRARWFVIIENRLYVEPGIVVCNQTRQAAPLESYTSFFNAELVQSLFPGSVVKPPVCGEWQHCCIVRNA
jgi:hypothetical protein